MLEYAESLDLLISFETSLNPKDFYNFIKNTHSNIAKVNYDMGNSASLGYDSDEEFELLGDYIVNVHIKDRIVNGTTVPLGTGDCNFDKVFQV